ncbi:MAG: hypothetical protein M3Z02_06220 [Actinomycetota bacterium]|nr:hypothetical protein [Actinomycetota bacterium]
MLTDYLSRRARAASPFDVVVVTARRADARAANEAVRAGLRATGQLGPDLPVPTTPATGIRADDGALPPRSVALGEVVLVPANDYRRGLLDGTRAVVTGADRGSGQPSAQVIRRVSGGARV